MNEQMMQQMMQMMMMMNPQLAAGITPATPAGAPVNVSKRPPVKLVPNKETQLAVTAYANNPEYGYIQVEEAQTQLRSLTWVGKVRRTALIKGDVVSLKEWIAENVKGGKLPGQIIVKEYVEGTAPEEITREFIGNTDTRDYEEAVKPFIKLAGKGGIPLTAGGERILRFSFYDQTGLEQDEKVKHDNGQDVAESARERRIAAVVELQQKQAAELKAANEASKTVVEPVAETVGASLPNNDDKTVQKTAGK